MSPTDPPAATAQPAPATRGVIRARVLIFLASALLALGALELGLRLVGSHYLASTVTPRGEVDLGEGTSRVLCVGDSFTYGGRVDRHETYPAHLQRLLRERHPEARVQVINQGVCEYNSFQLLQLYEEWLSLYQPRVVVLLVGGANRWNPWGYDFAEDEGMLARIGRSLARLRVVKLVRWIGLNLRGRRLAGEEPYMGIDGHAQGESSYMRAKMHLKRMSSLARAAEGSALEEAWVTFNRGQRADALAAVRRALAEKRGSREELLPAAGYFALQTGDYRGAEADYQKALAEHPGSRSVADQAAYFYSNVGREALKAAQYPRAIDYLFEAIRHNPDDEYLYYAMVKAFELQSTYDARALLDRCAALQKDLPALATNPKFQNHIKMFRSMQGWDKSVRTWLERDLERIAAITQKAGARLMVQTYPVSYPHANEPLKALAKRHALVLVDQTARFAPILASPRRPEYLHDDDHCTSRGHEVMAEELMGPLLRVLEKAP